MKLIKDKTVFLATFKAYYPIDQTIKMIEQLIEKVKSAEHPVHIAAPLTYLSDLNTHFADLPLKFGAEIMLSADPNAFTQPITGHVLQHLSCDFSLIGSSDERRPFSSSDYSFKNKIVAVLDHNITPILAIGESFHDFEDGHSIAILEKQLHNDLAELSSDQLAKITILYDSPWIANSCWGDTTEYVPKAYESFIKAITSFFGDKATSIPLFFSIPCFAEHLPRIPKGINLGGYYFGVMTPSHSIEPIHLNSHFDESESLESKMSEPLSHEIIQSAELPQAEIIPSTPPSHDLPLDEE